MTKVLVVTFDSSLKKLIDLTLKHNGFVVHTATDSMEAWKHLREIRFDFLMIDMQLSNESGLGFYKALRQYGNNIPIIMMGEGSFDAFMLKDLSTENYDFIIKPFKFRELRVKVNNFLEASTINERLVSFGELKIDVRQQVVMLQDTFIQLGKMEMKILMLLARKTGGFVHPQKIKALLQSEGNYYNMTTFYYISKLRGKLKKIAGDAFDISLVKDLGYKLEFRV